MYPSGQGRIRLSISVSSADGLGMPDRDTDRSVKPLRRDVQLPGSLGKGEHL